MTLPFLDRVRPRREAPRQAAFEGFAQVRAYWEGLRQGAKLPARTALDPRGLSGVLDRVFLAERIGKGLAQVRISGSGLAQFAGADLRGLPLSCLFAADSRPLLAQTLERVFMEPAVAELDLGPDRGGAGAPVARVLLLPLADEAGRQILLGTISFREGHTAGWKFQVLARREERLVLAATPLAEECPVEPNRRFGHLTLVHTSE